MLPISSPDSTGSRDFLNITESNLRCFSLDWPQLNLFDVSLIPWRLYLFELEKAAPHLTRTSASGMTRKRQECARLSFGTRARARGCSRALRYRGSSLPFFKCVRRSESHGDPRRHNLCVRRGVVRADVQQYTGAEYTMHNSLRTAMQHQLSALTYYASPASAESAPGYATYLSRYLGRFTEYGGSLYMSADAISRKTQYSSRVWIRHNVLCLQSDLNVTMVRG